MSFLGATATGTPSPCVREAGCHPGTTRTSAATRDALDALAALACAHCFLATSKDDLIGAAVSDVLSHRFLPYLHNQVFLSLHISDFRLNELKEGLQE